MVALHIGFDDTDSPRGGCTTYIAALLVEKLSKVGVEFTDFPNLIRLNPNVPWKTRGNGAVCLRIACGVRLLEKVFEIVLDTVEDNSDLGFRNTDPGIVFLQGSNIPAEIKAFSRRTIQSIVKMEDAIELVKKFKGRAIGYGKGYGIVGALAAIGEVLDHDHTYELIAYRTHEYRGSKRKLDPRSVKEMTQKTEPQTFNNIDPETGRILITPRGPDPILYGIRGETAKAVAQAHNIIRALEPIERWTIFRTNQGTDSHLETTYSINEVKPYHPVIVNGTVASSVKLIPRRHRVFSIEDETGRIDCAAYEPTGTLRKIVRFLSIGDTVEVLGGVRPIDQEHPLTINLEKLRILKLATKLRTRNPKCPMCGKRTCSMGRDQGYRCKKCGFKSSYLKKTMVEEKRNINAGLFITSPRSQRHLTRPMIRYGKEKTEKPCEMPHQWHAP